MALRRRIPTTDSIEVAPIIRLWLLRIVVALGAHRECLQNHGFTDDGLAKALGQGHWIDAAQHAMPAFLRPKNLPQPDREFDRKVALEDLRATYLQAEARLSKAKVAASLGANILKLSSLAGLSATDQRILEFAVSIHNEPMLDNAADSLGSLTTTKTYRVLSIILDIPEPKIRESLSTQSILSCSGLLSLERTALSCLRGKLNLLSDRFADVMDTAEDDPINLLRGTVSAAGYGHLGLADYAHISPSLDILRPYLRQALAKGQRGVNVFLHGPPGTGKSQLARALAQDLGCELFEISSEDADGDPVNGTTRLRSFRAAQSFLGQRKALIVFDEVEDVFNDADRFASARSTAQDRKAWMNRTLEQNPVPSLWLSNTVSGLDPAFIRRFDMVFELAIPPKKQREQILLASCGDLVDAKRISRISEAEALAPAVVTKASFVVRSIQDELGQEKAAAAFERLLSNTLMAQGHGPLSTEGVGSLPEIYDPRFVNADTDLVALAEGLVSSPIGRLCLNGPPGTGKTAYGYWLAQRLGMPLIVKRASDLMSKWVGGSEKNIASAFKQAKEDGGLLLIDEVDSFLQDRRGAHRSWEVTQVNEMLTQMESFNGVFIASTNLMDGLDQAALRRFDLKVKFDFLKPEQAAQLLHRHCEELALDAPQDGQLSMLRQLEKLTPGDFAAVRRQHRFRPIQSADAIVQALAAECLAKEKLVRPIGFLH